MNILVTGAAGFIGSHLTDLFVGQGHDVFGVDNFTTGRRENINPKVTMYECDAAHPGRLLEVFVNANPDVVVHCAASYHEPDNWKRDIQTNTRGTALVAEFASACHLVYFQTALPPFSSYAISKIAGEHYIDLSGAKAVTFRLANIYGPRNLSGPIPTFYKRLKAGEPCTVTETRRDTVYIADLVELVDLAVWQRVTGKVDVCSGVTYPIRRYHHAVCEATGIHEKPTVIPKPADDVNQMQLDPAPARTMFGWAATTSLEDGIRETVDWYDENGVGETYTHLKLAA